MNTDIRALTLKELDAVSGGDRIGTGRPVTQTTAGSTGSPTPPEPTPMPYPKASFDPVLITF
jgi:hypothetical protein